MPSRVRKAVLPVAGLGTRFLPATKVIAKEMIPVIDKPVVQYAIEEARDAGIEEFIFVTADGKESIANHFSVQPVLESMLAEKRKYAELKLVMDTTLPPGGLHIVKQHDPLGLGHAVWCAKSLVGNEPFAVILPDDMVLSGVPCLKQLIDAHAQVGGHVVAVEDVPREMTNRYGILDIEREDGRLSKARGLVEKPSPEKAPSTLAIIGRYVLDPVVFAELDKRMAGAGGEIQLTDALNRSLDRSTFHGYRFEGRRYDCGTRVGFVEANLAFALAHPDMRDRMVPIVERLLKEYRAGPG
ncbi:MAG: UTP--glucose-1-phosphate uridylyltransferase [Alphaproteobacteria bacterium]|nr:UTP--glucose-1-phosphate uridylyltransferase [Alphaproteobacteria bacterium]